MSAASKRPRSTPPQALEILRENQWKGKPAIIIGGGPSLRDVDPSIIPPRVPTIGCNGAYLWDPTIVLAIDWRFFDLVRYRDDWNSCSSIKIMHKSCVQYPAAGEVGAYWIARGAEDLAWGSNLEEGLINASNCGVLAVNLADILGADPILLFGFDMRGADGRSANFHSLYPDSWRGSETVYDRFLGSFVRAFEYSRGRIVNCNPDSGLYYFPKCTIEEGVAIATGETTFDELFPHGKTMGMAEGQFVRRCKDDEGDRSTASLCSDGHGRLCGSSRRTRGDLGGDTSGSRGRRRDGDEQPDELAGDRDRDGSGDRDGCSRVVEGEEEVSDSAHHRRALRSRRIASDVDHEVERLFASPSNINEHLLTLRAMARGLDTVAEFGSGGSCLSTTAFIAGRPRSVLSFSIQEPPEEVTSTLIQYGEEVGTEIEFIETDTRQGQVLDSDVDLLFIDSLHSFDQVTNELAGNEGRVRQFLVFHDIISFGLTDEDSNAKRFDVGGILPAILLFLRDRPYWRISEVFMNCNGLLILERDDARWTSP